MRDLSFRGPPQLAVAENATTPTGVLGAVIWSTTAGKKLEWDGSKWAVPLGTAVPQITVSATPPADPVVNQLWLDIS
ncbi:hypothetical protein [Hydrogenophaga defluvii]|uniref:Uncharacterized protein n=1 Tax=Hydrogenophaga defluvii TaxID=249410 RepID=A0ABW2SB98_9BURK